MIHNQNFQLCHVCVLHPSRGKLSIKSQFVNYLTYCWGIINYCTMKTLSELWLSFSIPIWWSLKIHKTCCLSFSPLIHPTYSCTLYIWCVNNMTFISICLLIFCIIKLSIFLFLKNTTPIIIYISVISIYIFVIKFCTMMYKVRKYWLCRIKERTALGPFQIDPSCKFLSKASTTHLPCECLRTGAISPI